MSNRLELIASLVTDGIGTADVGTDHAYLPVMLAKRGYTGNLIGTDINIGPLRNAHLNLLENGLIDRIQLINCDGLSGCSPDSIDTIIVAGMGGDTITGILDRAEWCSRDDIKLILQPVTKSEILRYWLINNDFIITREELVSENGTVYQVICAVPGRDMRYSDAELYTGRFALIGHSPLFDEHISTHIKRFEHAVEGLRDAKRNGLEAWRGILENILEELYNANR